MKKLVLLCALLLPFPAFGEMMHYSRCKLNDGKTIDDVQAWVTSWRALAKKEGVEYRVRLLLPHADSQLEANEFFIEGGSPTFQSYAKAWDWWYTDSEASTSADMLNAAATCNSGSVYRSND